MNKNTYLLSYSNGGTLVQTFYENEDDAINEIIDAGLSMVGITDKDIDVIADITDALEYDDDYEIKTDKGNFGLIPCDVETDTKYTTYAYVVTKDKETHEWYITSLRDIPYAKKRR